MVYNGKGREFYKVESLGKGKTTQVKSPQPQKRKGAFLLRDSGAQRPLLLRKFITEELKNQRQEYLELMA